MPGTLNVNEKTQVRLNTKQTGRMWIGSSLYRKKKDVFPEMGEGKHGCVFGLLSVFFLLNKNHQQTIMKAFDSVCGPLD